MIKRLSILLCCLAFACSEIPETDETVSKIPASKGNLFIIGGGPRPLEMIEELVRISITDDGYALVMSQSSAEPDTSFFYIRKQLVEFTDRPIIHLDSSGTLDFPLDSIEGADLIYMTGGNQNRFLRAVPETHIKAIHRAYSRGATIAGSSAGAALMSKVMITGDQQKVPEYESTYSRLEKGNAVISEGLGLLDSVVVDQHFVARSRYNRVLSVMADLDYPLGAGIEESTALIVLPEAATVLGEGQVIIFSRPSSYHYRNGKIGFTNMNLNAYLQGDTFQLK